MRAVWDEEHSKWWFSAVDIISAITNSPNPRKYWSVLKTRLKKEGNQLATICSQLKLPSSDGKRYVTDCFSQEIITTFVKATPSKKSADFLDWFTYSDNTIDGQSRKKSYNKSMRICLAEFMIAWDMQNLCRAIQIKDTSKKQLNKLITYSWTENSPKKSSVSL